MRSWFESFGLSYLYFDVEVARQHPLPYAVLANGFEAPEYAWHFVSCAVPCVELLSALSFGQTGVREDSNHVATDLD